MIVPTAVTLRECRRRVSLLALLLVALAPYAQEAETPVPLENPLRVPDIVITGADAIIIVPPLPVLPGGAIPVPQVELEPIPFLPSPTGCERPFADAMIDVEPVCIELSALSDWLPFFLIPGDPPVPVMKALGIHYIKTGRESGNAQNNGGDE